MTHLITLSLLVACPATDTTQGDEETTSSPYSANVTTAEDVRELSHFTTGEALLMLGYLTPFAAIYELYDEPGENCPAWSEDEFGSVATIDAGAGCTDEAGVVWSGSLVTTSVDLDGDGWVDIWDYTMDQLSYRSEWSHEYGDTGEEETYTSSIDFVGDGTFSLDLTDGHFEMLVSLGYVAQDSLGEYEALDMSADYVGTYIESEDGYVISGEGEATVNDLGTVYTVSTGQVWDAAACDDEFTQGTLSLEGGGNIAEITFDGATSCDSDRTGTWTLNGVDKGQIKNVGSCSTTGSSPASFLGWLVLPLGLVASRRRRS